MILGSLLVISGLVTTTFSGMPSQLDVQTDFQGWQWYNTTAIVSRCPLPGNTGRVDQFFTSQEPAQTFLVCGFVNPMPNADLVRLLEVGMPVVRSI